MTNEKDVEQNDSFDAIVIGSGVGGLTTATLLTRAAGMRVLVLEKHYEIGGFTHAFRRRGYSFDTGLHYVGQMGDGQLARRISDTMTGGKLEWNKMPSEYDIFSFPSREFAVPEGEEAYREKLIAEFPHEKGAIRRYFRDLKRAARWQTRDSAARFMPPLLSFFVRLTRMFGARLGLENTKRYLERRFSDPKLAALVVSQWGDYGIPPEESSFGVHALIATHYLGGAWYPAGGPERIARYAEEVIESAGGRILTQAEAVAIPTVDDTAAGVLVHHLDAERDIFYRADHVISSIGARETFARVAADGDEKRAVDKTRSALEEQDTGYSCVILFLGLSQEPGHFGSTGANHWLHATDEHPPMDALTQSVLEGRPHTAYLSFPGQKAGDDRPQTAELIAFVDPKAFDRWKGSDWQERGGEYEALKERIGDGLIDLAESRLPGFRAAIDYRELATPLSVTQFTSRPDGRMYGLAATAARYRSHAAQTRTPVSGLYLSGSDVVSVGIVGAMVGGLGPALQIAGPAKVFPTLYKPSSLPTSAGTTRPADDRHVDWGEVEPISGDKRPGELLGRRSLGNEVYELVLSAPSGVHFIPGQFARIEVAPYEWRDYSIASYRDESTPGARDARITLVIDAQFAGAGGTFAANAPVGATVSIRMPVGSFVYQRSGRPAVFVATGTGITPFVPMLAAEPDEVRVFFGCRTKTHDLSERYVPEGVARTVCVSRERVEAAEEVGEAGGSPVTYREGHVTRALEEQVEAGVIDLGETDFYLCGNPDMVQEVRAMLLERGARYIYQEAY